MDIPKAEELKYYWYYTWATGNPVELGSGTARGNMPDFPISGILMELTRLNKALCVIVSFFPINERQFMEITQFVQKTGGRQLGVPVAAGPGAVVLPFAPPRKPSSSPVDSPEPAS